MLYNFKKKELRYVESKESYPPPRNVDVARVLSGEATFHIGYWQYFKDVIAVAKCDPQSRGRQKEVTKSVIVSVSKTIQLLFRTKQLAGLLRLQSYLQPRNDDISVAKQTVKDLTTQRLNVLTSKNTLSLTLPQGRGHCVRSTVKNLLTYSPTNLLTLKSTPHPVFRFSAKAQNRKQTSPSRGEVKKVAFTLAEVLITLGIIGIVAAMTIPTLVSNHKKKVIETRLKHSYSLLSQAVNFAVSEHGSIANWGIDDRELDTEDLVKTYILPYIKTTELKKKNDFTAGIKNNTFTINLSNGTEWYMYRYIPQTVPFSVEITVRVDINGHAKPNRYGIDRFTFYIVPEKAAFYNTGNGDSLKNVPSEGVYYDGYGYSDSDLRTHYYRGCMQSPDIS